MANQLQDFLETIQNHPELRTEIVSVGPKRTIDQLQEMILRSLPKGGHRPHTKK